MMGGSGGRYFPTSDRDLDDLLSKVRDTLQQKKLDADTNALLQRILAQLNQRKPKQVRRYLDQLRTILQDVADIEQLLLAGSVAKHTYVDEQSDVDALVILKPSEARGLGPQNLLDKFATLLRSRLVADRVTSVRKGGLAVTIRYRDGNEIQLLPSLKSGSAVLVPSADKSGWNKTHPRAFQRALTRANKRLDGALVPTIKLFKKIAGRFPEQKRLTGYHCEALALVATEGYTGPATAKALLVHTLQGAARRVLRPISDMTGQSATVDAYLGRSGSAKRRLVADALAGVARRLDAATSVDQWKRTIEPSK